jgi:hypothetical protein
MVRGANRFHLRVVFVLAWTIDDASSLSWWLLYQFHFVCSLSSGIITPPKLNTILRCGTAEKVAMELPSHFDFLPLPFIPKSK